MVSRLGFNLPNGNLPIRIQLICPRQNWLKIESSKSSVVVLPTIFADRIDADPQIQRDQFQRQVPAQCFERPLCGRAGALQGILMPRVDHHLQHLRANLAAPDRIPNRVFESFESCPGET